MHRTLPAIVTDLEIRACALLESLSARPIPAELSERVQSVRASAEILRGEIGALRRSVGDEATATDDFDRHVDLNYYLRLFEHFDLPLIERWSEADRMMTEMCHALLDQVGWTFERPLVACWSTDYYWAQPVRKIIAVPAGEEQRLLAIGDLAHELGHLAFSADSMRFAGSVMVAVARYVQEQQASPPAWLGNPADFFGDLKLSWRQWLQEFGCDAFATYLTGPAFAWQHLRLACMEVAAPMYFEPVTAEGIDHPADDARMRASLEMLRLLGHGDEADAIAEHWSGLLAIVGAAAPPEYDAAYPDELLRAVAASVKDHCESLGLRPYDAGAGPDDVARLANEAWRRLHGDPDGYRAWERMALNERRARWGA